MGGLEAPNQPYEKVRDLYEEYERESTISERIGQMCEESVRENTMLLYSLIDATGFEIDEDTRTEIGYHSPVERIDFKRESLESIVAALIDQGEWRSAIED